MLAGTSWPPVTEYSWVIFHGINHQGNQILVKSEITPARIQGGGNSGLSHVQNFLKLHALADITAQSCTMY